MKDGEIVDLYWERSESAIDETARKYGNYCHWVSYSILRNSQDAEECVNDTWLRAWKAMPPHRPERLSVFLGKITRNLSFNRYKGYTAQKRRGSRTEAVLDELAECVPAGDNVEEAIDRMALTEAINGFLEKSSATDRVIFMRRYWYLCPIKEIAAGIGMNENSVKTRLSRMRGKLKNYLEKEGISV